MNNAMRIAAALGGVVLLGAGAFWLTRGDARDAGPEFPQVEITPRSAGPVGWRVAPNESIAIAASEVDGRNLIVVDLVLGEPSADDEPLTGRILSLDQDREDRVREIEGEIIGEGRGTTRIQIPAAWLREDTYLVEIKTTEKSHFPLRRYRIEVR